MTKLLTALTVATILAAMAAAGTVKTKIFHTVEAVAALPTVTISVEELQRQVDVRTLPVTKIENLY
jgi:peroxiredoxin family protein